MFILIGLLAFMFCDSSWALPSHRRLWEQKYGYKTSCTLCHSKGGGSQLNPYGEDFQRFGMTPAAFVSIENRDSDKNGFTNIEKIRAKSNPGDPFSTPTNPGDWLSRIEESMIPMDELKKIFSEVNKFSLLEGTLFPDQTKGIETKLGQKLSEADSVPTFYFAVKDQNDKLIRIGVAIFSTSTQNPDKLIVGIGVDLSGKITSVILIKNKLSESLNNLKFLSQFKDKNLDSAFQINKDIQPATAQSVNESTEVVEIVKKSLLIIAAVFNKDKKDIKPQK